MNRVFEGHIEVHAGLNGYPDNRGLLHWEFLDQGGADGTIFLHVRTRHSRIELGMAARLRVEGSDNALIRNIGSQGYPSMALMVPVRPREAVTLEKVVTVFTSREASNPLQSAQEKLRLVPDYSALALSHRADWESLWADSDVLIEGDPKAQVAVRYNLLQVLIAAPRLDGRVSIPAKTLSGFGYRGHIFWDTDIFIVPFLALTQPALARNLLCYRYHTLPGARRNAAKAGCQGARFAWESADTGDEVTPRWVPDADGQNLIRIWCGDSEIHITADVLMLLYLLREAYDSRTLKVNWDYYAPRTDHTYGSSLSPAVHAILACILGMPDEAYTHFMRAALADLEDLRGNTADGIHAASAGGVWQAVVFGFGGVRIEEAGPVATARLPSGWTRLRFRLRLRGQIYDFDLRPEGKSPPDIRGVIFDLDGVLTDTSEFHYLGWKRLADEEGIPFDRQANEALRGLSRRDSLLRILGARKVSEEKMQEMMARKNKYYQEFVQDLSPADLLPGVNGLLDELRSAGVKVAIGSASKNARDVIERLGLAGYVDALSDGHSVEHHKPAPDLFLHAASQLGLEPSQCLVIEDAASGIEASLKAGTWVVGLGPPERLRGAHVILPSLEDVHWSDILARLAQAADNVILRRGDQNPSIPSVL